MLSGAELFKQRQGLEKTVPEKGGTKDYMPQGSWLENKRLQKFFEEREQVLDEPRIQRKCDWVKGTWVPKKQLVELFHEMRNFWQHMGFQKKQQKWLYPEEALFLMETNVLELWYRGVVLSLQEAYALLLGNHVSQEMYQVYCHLRRIGYVVIRHQGRSIVTSYERQIGLDKYKNKGKDKKRKRQIQPPDKDGADDNTPELSKCAKVEKITDQKGSVEGGQNQDVLEVRDDKMTGEVAEDSSRFTQKEAAEDNSRLTEKGDGSAQILQRDVKNVDKEESSSATDVSVEANQLLESCSVDIVGSSEDSKSGPNSIFDSKDASDQRDKEKGFKLTSWKFEDLNFPDFGVACDTVLVQASSSVQLLGDIEFTNTEYEFPRQQWLNKKVDMKQQHYKDILQFSYPDIMHAEFDRTGAYKNWRELKEGFLQKRKTQTRQQVMPHLHRDGLGPLVSPEKATSTSAVLNQLFVIKEESQGERLLEEPETLPDFDVYRPNMKFKKSQPGLPDHRVCVTRSSDSPPDLGVITKISQYLRDEVPLHWAVVDSGDIAFFAMSDFSLPIDITIG